MKHAIIVALLLCLAVTAQPAQAQVDSREGIYLQNQIAELRHEVEMLRDQLAVGRPQGGSSLGAYTPPAADASGNDMVAQLLVRIQSLEEQVRTMRGRIDEIDNARQRQGEDLAKQIGDLSFKLENGGASPSATAGAPPPAGTLPPGAPPPSGPAGPAPGAPLQLSPPPGVLALPGTTATAPPAAPAPPPPPPKRTAELILQEGNAALAKKDYAAAEADAHSVITAGGPRATDAQLLLARAFYGKRDYPNAAIAYDDAYRRSPTGPHAQDARLGLAASLAALGDKKAACGALEKLAVEFPTLRADLRPTAAALHREAGCRAT
jgi:TolA-binding protein